MPLAPVNTSSHRISGTKYCSDWKAIRLALSASNDLKLWNEVLADYYESRLELRYLSAIRTLGDAGEGSGEGFAIVAIQCSIIEFLESCWQGTNYRRLKKGETLGSFEYTASGAVFSSFLTQRTPFSAAFTTVALAEDFYSSIRCSVLHEACTKNGWRIWRRSSPSGQLIDATQKILYRDDFQDALRSFIVTYRAEVLQHRDRKDAFIRKFDHICNS